MAYRLALICRYCGVRTVAATLEPAAVVACEMAVECGSCGEEQRIVWPQDNTAEGVFGRLMSPLE